MSEEILDLDALAPQPRQIKFDNEIITVNPPSMGDLMEIYRCTQKFNDEKADMKAIETELTAIFVKLVPALAGKSLWSTQLLALEGIIAKMGTPEQSEELAKLGIDFSSTLEKKAQFDSPK